MPPTKGSENSLGWVIWQDLKILLASALLFGFTPLGLILMWSWGLWTPRVRKVMTGLGAFAILIFLAVMAGKHKNGQDRCGFGRRHGCEMGYGSGSCGGMDKGGGGDADDDEEESEKPEAPAAPASK